MDSAYQLRSTLPFEDEAEEFAGTLERWDEIFRGLDYGLSLNPKIGNQIGTTRLWVLELRIPRRPFIYYEINDENKTVTLLALSVFPYLW